MLSKKIFKSGWVEGGLEKKSEHGGGHIGGGGNLERIGFIPSALYAVGTLFTEALTV